MHERAEIFRDLLDKQLVDANETKMGRADGIVLEIDGDKQPRIDHLELGFSVLARRLGPRAEKWFEAIRTRWSVRKSARQIVPWSKVIDVTNYEIKLDLKAEETPAFDWERWVRNHIVAKIPGGEGGK
ncbi:MAG TPA: hypothetical protein VJ853_11005 [Thermoanaerobaculia bacterium]|nr:hypothetical protein [Thermoanaerobaculia bacterium]